jgi:hypothetical protein
MPSVTLLACRTLSIDGQNCRSFSKQETSAVKPEAILT